MRVADDGGKRRTRAFFIPRNGPQDRFDAARRARKRQAAMKLRGHEGIHVTTERRRETNHVLRPARKMRLEAAMCFPLRILLSDATVGWLNLERPLPGESWNNHQNAGPRGDLRWRSR
jgi:hypothetical protein